MEYNTVLKKEKLNKYLISKQVDALSNITGEDVLLDIIKDIVTFVRAEVMSFPGNILDKNPLSIPGILEPSTCHLIIEQLHSRIPSLDLSKDQIRNAENARKLLKRVAKGDLTLSKPKNENTPFLTINSRKRSFNNKNLKNL